jgi:hypothetical protein
MISMLSMRKYQSLKVISLASQVQRFRNEVDGQGKRSKKIRNSKQFGEQRA